MEDQHKPGRLDDFVQESDASARRRPYERPELTSYGSVSDFVLSTDFSDDIHSKP